MNYDLKNVTFFDYIIAFTTLVFRRPYKTQNMELSNIQIFLKIKLIILFN